MIKITANDNVIKEAYAEGTGEELLSELVAITVSVTQHMAMDEGEISKAVHAFLLLSVADKLADEARANIEEEKDKK